MHAQCMWNPHLVKHIHSTESIKRRATLLICGSVKSYSERLTEPNWSTLELRRKYLCLVQLYKIIHGYSDVDYTRYIDLTGPIRTRRNHDFKIRPRAARTNYLKFSFFNRYVNDWNSLPNFIMSASSLNVFKNRLFNYLCTYLSFIIQYNFTTFRLFFYFSSLSSSLEPFTFFMCGYALDILFLL